MKTKTPNFDQPSTLKNLPTLPHILLKLLEACNQESINLNEIAAIVSKDPALSAKLLKLVNSAYFGLPQKVQGIDQAVVYVGTNGIKNMAICACVYETFPNPVKNGIFNLKAFWWHSLRCGCIAKNIAVEMNSDQPDEAFTSGLLHDIGKLVLWANFRKAYEEIVKNSPADANLLMEEEARFGTTHSQVGKWLLKRWNFQPAIADHVSYHHEEPARIAHAFPMTQIVWIANLLSQDAETTLHEGISWAQKILNLKSDICHALIEKGVQEAQDVAAALDIDINVDAPASSANDENDRKKKEALTRDVRNASLLMGTLEGFLAANDPNDILAVISDGLNILLDINRFIYFRLDADKNVLYGYYPDANGQFVKNRELSVYLSLDQNLLVKAILKKKPLHSFSKGAHRSLTILDEQIIGRLDAQGIYCLPLIAQGDAVGVLVLGIEKKDLPHLQENSKLLNVFTNKGALALSLSQMKRRRLRNIQLKRIDASSDLARKVVHEVNNPLSIIKNYLKILEQKLSENDIARNEIRIINDEISRVANLLEKLTNFSKQPAQTHEAADINALITDIVTLTKDSLQKHSNINLRTDLEPNLPKVDAEGAGLKQVFINLIKNAVEAMVYGGNIYIRTRYFGPSIIDHSVRKKKEHNGYIEVQFKDDGPGIPEAIKEKIFDPYISSKRDGHSGLGLSIAYNIIRSFNGNLICKNTLGYGTEFIIELPEQGNSRSIGK